MKFSHHGYRVHVFQQRHKDYPPWVAFITRDSPGKVYVTNVEGETEHETAERARNKIEQLGRGGS